MVINDILIIFMVKIKKKIQFAQILQLIFSLAVALRLSGDTRTCQ